jgi:hypothetical protein
MGGYGHSRLREQLLGGVTDNLLHQSPVRPDGSLLSGLFVFGTIA